MLIVRAACEGVEPQEIIEIRDAMREPGLQQLLVAGLEQVSAKVGVERGGVEAGRLERDDGTVDAPG